MDSRIDADAAGTLAHGGVAALVRSWWADAGGAVHALGVPGSLLVAFGVAALGGLVVASVRRAMLERRDRKLFACFEARLSAWAANSRIPAGPDLVDEARRVLDDLIERHVRQDPTLDGPARMRFAATLRSTMRQRLEDVLIRGRR